MGRSLEKFCNLFRQHRSLLNYGRISLLNWLLIVKDFLLSFLHRFAILLESLLLCPMQLFLLLDILLKLTDFLLKFRNILLEFFIFCFVLPSTCRIGITRLP